VAFLSRNESACRRCKSPVRLTCEAFDIVCSMSAPLRPLAYQQALDRRLIQVKALTRGDGPGAEFACVSDCGYRRLCRPAFQALVAESAIRCSFPRAGDDVHQAVGRRALKSEGHLNAGDDPCRSFRDRQSASRPRSH
jgi:hypothetical protein